MLQIHVAVDFLLILPFSLPLIHKNLCLSLVQTLKGDPSNDVCLLDCPVKPKGGGAPLRFHWTVPLNRKFNIFKYATY